MDGPKFPPVKILCYTVILTGIAFYKRYYCKTWFSEMVTMNDCEEKMAQVTTRDRQEFLEVGGSVMVPRSSGSGVHYGK